MNEPIIDIAYGYSPHIFYILTDYTICWVDIVNKVILCKINKDPTNCQLNNSNISAFKCLQTLSLKINANTSLSYSSCPIDFGRIVVVDDYDITIYDVRHMDKAVIGPVMHMMDEAYPRFISTSHILPSFTNRTNIGELFTDIEDEYTKMLNELEGEDELEPSSSKHSNSEQIICIF